jgi:hypothetical protein
MDMEYILRSRNQDSIHQYMKNKDYNQKMFHNELPKLVHKNYYYSKMPNYFFKQVIINRMNFFVQ